MSQYRGVASVALVAVDGLGAEEADSPDTEHRVIRDRVH